MIEDSAKAKLLLLDLVENIVGIPWEDRERSGKGKARVREALDAIAARYGHVTWLALFRVDDTDLPQPFHTWGGVVEDMFLGVEVPDVWCEIFRTRELANLPVVKFRSGKLYMTIDTMDVDVGFSAGLRALIKGQEFVYDNEAGWREQQSASPNDMPPPWRAQGSDSVAVRVQ